MLRRRPATIAYRELLPCRSNLRGGMRSCEERPVSILLKPVIREIALWSRKFRDTSPSLITAWHQRGKAELVDLPGAFKQRDAATLGVTGVMQFCPEGNWQELDPGARRDGVNFFGSHL